MTTSNQVSYIHHMDCISCGGQYAVYSACVYPCCTYMYMYCTFVQIVLRRGLCVTRSSILASWRTCESEEQVSATADTWTSSCRGTCACTCTCICMHACMYKLRVQLTCTCTYMYVYMIVQGSIVCMCAVCAVQLINFPHPADTRACVQPHGLTGMAVNTCT